MLDNISYDICAVKCYDLSVRKVILDNMNKDLNYFSLESHRSTERRESPPKDDVPHKGRNMLLSALVAFSAMFGYAIAAGLVQVRSKVQIYTVMEGIQTHFYLKKEGPYLTCIFPRK